jgi:hypothetical protein
MAGRCAFGHLALFRQKREVLQQLTVLPAAIIFYGYHPAHWSLNRLKKKFHD